LGLISASAVSAYCLALSNADFLELFPAIGAVSMMIAGAVIGRHWSLLGAIVGGITGVGIGFVLGALYLVIWFVFDLPPHADFDL
jgi:hypothetical protein